MTNLTYTSPSVGEKVTVAEPDVGTALTQIKKVVNGELGTGNLEATAGIVEGQLSTGVQTKLNEKTGAAPSSYKTSAISVTAASGEYIEMTGASTTVTLPTATASRVVGAFNRSSGEVKVKAAAGKIFGDFLTSTGVTEVVLTGNQHILLEANGSNWLIVAGEPKREQAYSARESQTAETQYTPSSVRDAMVTLEFTALIESGEPAYYDIKVNTTSGSRIAAVSLPYTKSGDPSYTSFCFRCPAGQFFYVEKGGSAAQAEYHASYLLL